MSDTFKIDFEWGLKIPLAKAEAMAHFLGEPLEKLVKQIQPPKDMDETTAAAFIRKPDIDEKGNVVVDIHYNVNPVVDISQFAKLGIPFRVEGRASGETFAHLVSILRTMQNTLEKVAQYKVDLDGQYGHTGQQFNDRVNVHVPGLGLLLIDEVTNMDNCCTDELRRMLNDGWRILAICPQPDQRRPDYILGRANTEPK